MATVSLPSSIAHGAHELVLNGEGAEHPAFERRGLRLETIALVRWLSIACQALAFLFVTLVLGFRPRPVLWSVLVGVPAAVNLGVALVGRRSRMASEGEAVVQLGFDVLQLAAVLFFTGGVANPFALLLIAPPTLAAISR